MKRLLTSTSALVWGIQASFLNPVLALLLVALYGASPGEVGWALAAYNTSGFVAALVIPAIADRRDDYLGALLSCAALTAALTVALAVITTLPVAVLALVVLGGPAGVGTSMLFAQMRAVGHSRESIINTRAIISFAWIAGPPVATLIMGAFGNRSILLALGVVAVANVATSLVMVVGQRREQHRDGGPARPELDHEPITRASMVTVVVVMILLSATNYAAVTAMSLVVTDRLHLPLMWAGIALGAAAAFEIPALFVIGRLTRRLSNRALMVTGAAAGIVYYSGVAIASGPVVLIALQVFNAWFVAITAGVGMTWFQQAIRSPGLGTALAGNARRVGGVLSGPLIGFAAVTSWGYQGVFALCAVLSAIALATVPFVRAAASSAHSDRAEASVPESDMSV